MPKITHLKKAPGEIALETAMRLDVEKTTDTDQYSSSVNTTLRNEGVSLSQELCMIRKTVEILCKKDSAIQELDDVKEFLEYCDIVNKIKEEVKMNQKHDNSDEN